MVSNDPPAAPGSAYPALAAEGATTVDKGHDILMTWLEPGARLRFARYSQGAWTEPITVADRVSILHPADRPSLVVFDTQAVRRTLIARTGDVIARSGNAGRTWGRLPASALPFASFAGGDEGGYAFWLRAEGEDGGSARLLGTRILAGESLLDPRTTGGSSTAAVMTWDGPVVVYRDQGAQGSVDIAVVRRQNAQWTPSRPIHVGGWRPAQKPDSGPQAAAQRRRVAVVWYTESAHRPRVLAAFSDDAGRTFDDPLEVDIAAPGRDLSASVGVALDDDGDALVLWLTGSGSGGSSLQLARLSSDGNRGEALVIAEGLAVGPQDIPQITRVGPQVAVTWTSGDHDRPESRQLRLVTVPLAKIPGPITGAPDSVIADVEADPPQFEPVADPLPGLELVSLDGAGVSLPSQRGHAVLLNLWATWCIPCRTEIPELVTLYEEYAGEGLRMVGLSVDDAAAGDRVREFVAEYEIPFDIWLDPEMRLYSALRVKALPVTIVIDRDGRMILRRDGTITADDLELREALRLALEGG